MELAKLKIDADTAEENNVLLNNENPVSPLSMLRRGEQKLYIKEIRITTTTNIYIIIKKYIIIIIRSSI